MRSPPIIGQQQAQAEAAIRAAIQQMGASIYSQLATQHIATRDEHQQADHEHLRQLARDANTAARAYFEALGIIQQANDAENGQ